MKVKNLYIGSILLIKEEKDNYNNVDDTEKPEYVCNLERISIFYKPRFIKNKVIDLLESETYSIGFPKHNPEIGSKYVDCLDSSHITKVLQKNNYIKSNISKKKLLKIMENDTKNQEKVVK